MQRTIIVTFEWEGRHRAANVKTREGDFENMYRVVMDDGYENDFFTTVGQPFTWYEAQLGATDLAQVIGRSIEKHLY
ncbi:MAG TPA: hypothetical protein VM888_10440 [Chitinophagaceae bacterium]|nr:hypothetical protein [Chitinophagaceae bacterium]